MEKLPCTSPGAEQLASICSYCYSGSDYGETRVEHATSYNRCGGLLAESCVSFFTKLSPFRDAETQSESHNVEKPTPPIHKTQQSPRHKQGGGENKKTNKMHAQGTERDHIRLHLCLHPMQGSFRRDYMKEPRVLKTFRI